MNGVHTKVFVLCYTYKFSWKKVCSNKKPHLLGRRIVFQQKLSQNILFCFFFSLPFSHKSQDHHYTMMFVYKVDLDSVHGMFWFRISLITVVVYCMWDFSGVNLFQGFLMFYFEFFTFTYLLGSINDL